MLETSRFHFALLWEASAWTPQSDNRSSQERKKERNPAYGHINLVMHPRQPIGE